MKEYGKNYDRGISRRRRDQGVFSDPEQDALSRRKFAQNHALVTKEIQRDK
jgi:hypothetical protein